MFRTKLLAFLMAFVFIYSPWSFFYSRMVSESNIALLFYSIGLLFLIERGNILMSVFFGLSMYGYHTEWILVPLIYLYVLLVEKLSLMKKSVLILVVSIMILPIFADYLYKTIYKVGSIQANSQTIWKSPDVEDKIRDNRLIINKISPIVKAVIYKYFFYSDPGIIFFNSGMFYDKKHPLEVGLIPAPFIIWIILGIWYSITKLKNKNKFFIFYLLLISPLVPAFTKGGYNHPRNLTSIIPYLIFIAIGGYFLFVKKRKVFYISISISIFYIFMSYISYKYYYAFERADTFQGYSPIANFLSVQYPKFKKVIIDDRFGKQNNLVGVPYLFIAYFDNLHKNLPKKPLTLHFNDIQQKWINWNETNIKDDTWYIVSYENSPKYLNQKNMILVRDFRDVSDRPAFEIWKTKN